MQATQITYVKCSNYQTMPNCDHWQIKCESPAHPQRSSRDFQTAWTRPLTPFPGRLRAIWKSDYEEVEASVHKLVNRGDWPRFPSGIPGVGGFKWLVHILFMIIVW